MKKHGSLNHIYRLVWSQVLKAWVAVAENTKGRGKGKNSSGKLVAAALSLAGIAGVLPPALAGPAISQAPIATAMPSPTALPTGYQVTAGSASISQTGNTLTVQENSQRAAINWQTFTIGSNGTVNFIQPNSSAVVLNLVVGNEASVITGALHANGQVFLLNSNGVLFTKDASVNVGGLVASTLNMTDSNFMAGKMNFNSNGSRASVINQGSLSSDNGYVALLGNQVVNQGVITARLGTAILASGDQISLNFNGSSLVNVVINKGTLDALVSNQQAIYADGGQVILTAKAADTILASAVNNTGEIRAQTIANQSGKIVLLGDMQNGTVNVGGRLDASAPNGGNGGAIETSAAHVEIANNAKVTTAAAFGLTGSWLLDPVDFNIAASGGDISGSALGLLLNSNSVTIQTTAGTNTATNVYANVSTGTTGNINVNDTVTWSANKLTLSAYNNININVPMVGSGTASLALLYGQGASDGVINAVTASYNVNAPVTLPAGNNFSTQLGSNSANLINYTVITSLGAQNSVTVTDLQGMNNNLSGNFALGSNIDATPTGLGAWGVAGGFTPIGTGGSTFTGIFDGLGHTISNLYINQPSTNWVGLFGYGASARISNVGLIGANINGGNAVGSLMGFNDSGIINNSSARSVNVSGGQWVGGLVGISYGTVSNSSASGSVAGSTAVGGLVGANSTYYGTGGSILNSFANATVSSSSGTYIGGLAGENGNVGTVSNSYSTGSVNVSGSSYVGGLVGVNLNSSNGIANSYSTSAVSGNNNVHMGGLVGENSGNLSYAYSTGSVSGTGNTNVGGLVGTNTGIITNAYELGAVNISTGTNVGALLGANYGSVSGTIYNKTANPGLVGFGYGQFQGANPADISGTIWGMTPAQMNVAANFNSGTSANGGTSPGWIFTSTPGLAGNNWVIVDTDSSLNNASGNGATTPMLSSEYSTSINNAHQLQLMSMNLAGSYTVGQNIDATATNGIASDVWLSSSYAPVGSQNLPFTGTFNGQGNTINALTINLPNQNYVGLFGNAVGASIGNVILTGGSVTGASYVGMLAGANNSGIINNASASGTVASPIGASTSRPVCLSFSLCSTVGGLVGFNYGQTGIASVSNSSANVTVSGMGANSGGLVGSNYAMNFSAVIDSSSASGNVNGSIIVGGLVGSNLSGNGVLPVISNSHATGNVTGNAPALTAGTAAAIGGLVGFSSGNVTNTYATGSVTGSSYVGGLAGFNYGFGGSLTNSHATGSVSGTSMVGGLVGNNWAEMSGVYATGNVTGTGAMLGGLVGVNSGALTDVHATGTVMGTGAANEVGGLLGNNTASVSNAYSTGPVSGSSEVGGLVGYNLGILSNAFYNIDQVLVNGVHQVNAGGIYNAQYVDWSGHGEVLNIANYASSLPVGSGGYYNVGNQQSLQDMLGFSESNAALNFRLTSNISLGAGFYVPYFAGSFDGAGYAISGLALNRPDSMLAMFGFLPAPVTLNSVLVKPSISNLGVSSASITGNGFLGGLVGYNYGAGAINNTHASVAIVGSGKDVGGLVGGNGNANHPAGSISNSYSSGTISGSEYIGGLIGYNYGATISNSYSTVNSSGGNVIGGLIGYNYGGTVHNSFATGNAMVTGDTAGGLVGASSSGAISNTYATGNVSVAGGNGGGLVGSLTMGSLANSYSTGIVDTSQGTQLGGLVGNGFGFTLTNSFYSKTANPTLTGISGASDVAGTVMGMTAAQMQSQTNFTTATSANGNVAPGWNFTADWYQYSGHTAPLLQAFMAPLTISAPTSSQVYNDQQYLNTAVTYSVAPDQSHLFGTLGFSGGGTNVGNYTVMPTGGLWSDQFGYMITYASGTQSVTPAPLTITASNATKVYGQSPALSAFVASGLVGGQTIGSVTEASNGSAVTAGVSGSPYAIVPSSAIGGSFNAANYTITYINGALTVTPLALTISTINGATRVYDGTANAASDLLVATNLINGDSVTLSGNGTLAGSAVGSEAVTSLSGLSINNSNYTLTGAVPGGAVLITSSGGAPVDNTGLSNAIADAFFHSQAVNYLPPELTATPNPVGVPAPIPNPAVQLSSLFGDVSLAIVSAPTATELTQVVSMSQARELLQSGSGDGSGNGDGATEVRVPVARNSLAEIVNGGVRLPTGVEQQLFVVKN